jgi:hypothetical protein
MLFWPAFAVGFPCCGIANACFSWCNQQTITIQFEIAGCGGIVVDVSIINYQLI